MAHQSIQSEDHGPYYEGDALEIPIQVVNEAKDETVNIADHTAEFRLKEALTDPDSDALLEKTTGDSGVEITDAANGVATVHIETSDTSDVLNSSSGPRLESDVFQFHFRIINPDGDRVTTLVGDWEIHAA